MMFRRENKGRNVQGIFALAVAEEMRRKVDKYERKEGCWWYR